MTVHHIFKFLESIVGISEPAGYILKGDWKGIVAKWDVDIEMRSDRIGFVKLRKEFEIGDLNTGKQTFAEKLREAATLLVSMADEAESEIVDLI